MTFATDPAAAAKAPDRMSDLREIDMGGKVRRCLRHDGYDSENFWSTSGVSTVSSSYGAVAWGSARHSH